MVLLCTLSAAGQSLPEAVDNSTSRHFPPVFSQAGGSCAQASSIGYLFTYEMNALLDRDASIPENRFSYIYTWNIMNDGYDQGTFQFDGLKIATSNGMMTETDFPKQDGLYQFKWASGYDKYINALHYQAERFINITIQDTTDLLEAKGYLFNKGVEGGKGGVLTFSSQATHWRFDIPYEGPSATGYKSMLTSLATSGAHAMTIVGYDDLVEFERPDGVISKGAFIVMNSYGEDYYLHDRGRFYLPYWFFISEHESSALNNSLMGIVPVYVEHPKIIFKVALDYTSRNDLSFRFGVSGQSYDDMPKHDYKFPIYDHHGGDHPMQGRDCPSYIEFVMDFSKYAARADEFETPNWFLTVTRADRGRRYGEGVMRAFEVVDFREDPENPKVYTHESIDGQVLENGYNIFNIPSVKPDSCSYSPVPWLNRSGQPIAAPFIVRTADGKYAKIRLSEYDDENGTIRIKYVYAPSGGRNLE